MLLNLICPQYTELQRDWKLIIVISLKFKRTFSNNRIFHFQYFKKSFRRIRSLQFQLDKKISYLLKRFSDFHSSEFIKNLSMLSLAQWQIRQWVSTIEIVIHTVISQLLLANRTETVYRSVYFEFDIPMWSCKHLFWYERSDISEKWNHKFVRFSNVNIRVRG